MVIRVGSYGRASRAGDDSAFIFCLTDVGGHRPLTTSRTKAMAKISKDFPLDFNAQEWTVEEALPWVFFGDYWNNDNWTDLSEFTLRFVVGEADERSALRYLTEDTRALQKHFREHGVMRRQTSFSPLVWCRLAIQLWLKRGGRQETFMLAMSEWIRKKNKGGAAYVFYRHPNTGKNRKMSMDAFLFAGSELPDLQKTQWKYKQKAATLPPPKVESQRSEGRTDENQVGANLLAAVKVAVADLVESKRNKSSLLRGPGPNSERCRFRGRREDLLNEICRKEPSAKGKWTFRNGGGGAVCDIGLT